MRNRTWLAAAAVLVFVSAGSINGEIIAGRVVDQSGKAMNGVMVSAFDKGHRKIVSAFTQADGSYAIDGLRAVKHSLRARLLGQEDEWRDNVKTGSAKIEFRMKPATGDDLQDQRPASSGFSMLKFDNLRDKLNFKMMCSYCHQVGTVGFRSPEKPVDWETMLRRMDGFGGLYRHTQKTIVKRLMDTYKDDAVSKWPRFIPAPAPTGLAAKARITSWEIGKRLESSFHDLELGPDGLIYAVNISKHRIVTLDPATGEQRAYQLPRGSYGPHSIELANDGHMWLTICASGQMAKFDLNTKKYTICSSAEAPAKRGSYPHTLRINPKDPEGLIWYTDAGRNSCFSLHPKTLKVKEYKLLKAHQAVSAGKVNPAASHLTAWTFLPSTEPSGTPSSTATASGASTPAPPMGTSRNGIRHSSGRAACKLTKTVSSGSQAGAAASLAPSTRRPKSGSSTKCPTRLTGFPMR